MRQYDQSVRGRKQRAGNAILNQIVEEDEAAKAFDSVTKAAPDIKQVIRDAEQVIKENSAKNHYIENIRRQAPSANKAEKDLSKSIDYSLTGDNKGGLFNPYRTFQRQEDGPNNLAKSMQDGT